MRSEIEPLYMSDRYKTATKRKSHGGSCHNAFETLRLVKFQVVGYARSREQGTLL
jgi:hypothetical protein